MVYLQSLSFDDLTQLILPYSKISEKTVADSEHVTKSLHRAECSAKKIFSWAYKQFVTNWDDMIDLSKDLRIWLNDNVGIYQINQKLKQSSEDSTDKFLWSLNDGQTVESVAIPVNEKGRNRITLCISSQVGCAMGCLFCLTGTQGLKRNLETHEIVAQVQEIRKILPITNIVFMGMGEPLRNIDNVIKACHILMCDYGLGFPKRKITVSTSGVVPGIVKLGKSVDVSLAISLNATTNEIRNFIMPVNKQWQISELMEACKHYPLSSNQYITFEYVLLRSVNDSLEDAKRLASLLEGISCKVNLIPFNEFKNSSFKSPLESRVIDFKKSLLDQNVITTVRLSRGKDILASCGQLSGRYNF